jgi:5-bromo-4-chloroindolyl phosphate hydrolysis protein
MSNQPEIIDGFKLDYSGDELYQLVDTAIEKLLNRKAKEERDSQPDKDIIRACEETAQVLKQIRDHVKRDALYRLTPDEIEGIDHFLRRATRRRIHKSSLGDWV